jgi:YggT family protein
MVFRATDPVLTPIGSSLKLNQTSQAPLLVIVVLIILKGLLFPPIPSAFQGFFSFLFQVYALTLIVIMSYREYFVNPIVNFAQRLVNPVRAIAANVSRSLLAVNLISLAGIIVLHAVLLMILSAHPAQLALKVSLQLIFSLTTFFVYAIIINALLSWVSPDPDNPVVQLISLLTAPIVDPFRRIIPPLAGMLDLSPIAAIIALTIVRGVGNGLVEFLLGSGA